MAYRPRGRQEYSYWLVLNVVCLSLIAVRVWCWNLRLRVRSWSVVTSLAIKRISSALRFGRKMQFDLRQRIDYFI